MLELFAEDPRVTPDVLISSSAVPSDRVDTESEEVPPEKKQRRKIKQEKDSDDIIASSLARLADQGCQPDQAALIQAQVAQSHQLLGAWDRLQTARLKGDDATVSFLMAVFPKLKEFSS